MTTRDIEGHLKEMYGVEVSPDADLQSHRSGDGGGEGLAEPAAGGDLCDSCTLDALVVKMRDGGHVQNKAIYVAIGVNMEGNKEVLGLWAADNEGAKFWLQVLTELTEPRGRGYFHRLRGRTEGFSGSDRIGVSAH